jgi:type I restriction enzyme S subunit
MRLQRGHDLPADLREEGDVPVVSSSGITGFHREAKAVAPGVVTGRYGTLGEVFFLDRDYWPLNTALYVTDFKGNDPRFVAYFLRHHLKDYQSDKAAVPGIDRNVLHELKVRTPDLAIQLRMVDVLQRYDDLIDNNRRRIKLLEDSVRLLFDEWFCISRSTTWPTATLQALCVDDSGVQTGPFGSQLHQSDYTEEGVPVVMPKDLALMRIDTRAIARIPEHLADELGRHRMQRGDIVFGRRGEIGRRAYIGQRQVGYFCGTGCLRLRPDPARVNPRFLFEMLRAPLVAGEIANRAKGSTMANLSAGALQSVPVPIPPRALQSRFANFADDVAEQVDILDEQSVKLRTARDLLLPRLMSGELTV